MAWWRQAVWSQFGTTVAGHSLILAGNDIFIFKKKNTGSLWDLQMEFLNFCSLISPFETLLF